MGSAYNPKELKDEILMRLGAPIINIEVTEEQIYSCIQRALELFGEYHFNGTNKGYKVIKLDEDSVSGVFDLSEDNIFAVTKVLRTNANSLLTWDGSAPYQFVSDMIMGMAGVGCGGGYGCSSFYGPGSFGTQLSYYAQIQQYWGMMSDMLDPIPDFFYNDNTGQLRLNGNFIAGNIIVIEVYIKSFSDVEKSVGDTVGYGYVGSQDLWSTADKYDNPDRQLPGSVVGDNLAIRQGSYNNRWVKDYSTALVKEINGQVLAKHQGLQLSGGISIDGVRLIEEAKLEKESLRQELYELDAPTPILIG